MAKNIRYYMDKKGIDRNTLVADLGLKYMTVSDWVNAKTYPRIDKIELMANYFGIEKSDLVEEYRPSPKTNTAPLVQAVTDKMIQLHPERQESVLEYTTTQLEEQQAEQLEIHEPLALYSVQTVTKMAAGLGYAYDDDDINTVQVAEEPPRHDLASIVNGDSMLPDYEDGDVVYLKDTGFSSYSGQVCAVAVNDKSYLKKVYTEANCLRLVSLNPKYDDIIIDFPPSSDTHIKIYAVIGSDKVVQG
ncbi:XRE family transcriptional regulator [Streptococcus sp. ZJ100]|uniref:LexA family transcriptional regulator n=1 Tax=Streptococcus handemini TaxID=3161188 RepID=UPI0032EFB6E4